MANNLSIKKVKLIFLFSVVFIFLINTSLVLAVKPFGASITNVSSERALEDSAQSIPAIAGNVTEISIFGFSITQSWQGYFGNVSGTITLADSSDNTMYNWSLASPEGEIYASTNSSINWNFIQCLNFTADGSYNDDTINAGDTSLYGTNLTLLESEFGIEYDDVDGVNETFTLSGIGGHNNFYTNNFEFSEGECMSTRVFSNAGHGEEDKFEEVLLYEPTTNSVVFTSLLNENVFGFDNNPHDFEMLVLENGHLTDTSITPYYFWIELE